MTCELVEYNIYLFIVKLGYILYVILCIILHIYLCIGMFLLSNLE
jgi:hypothetical protein